MVCYRYPDFYCKFFMNLVDPISVPNKPTCLFLIPIFSSKLPMPIYTVQCIRYTQQAPVRFRTYQVKWNYIYLRDFSVWDRTLMGACSGSDTRTEWGLKRLRKRIIKFLNSHFKYRVSLGGEKYRIHLFWNGNPWRWQHNVGKFQQKYGNNITVLIYIPYIWKEETVH